MDADTLKKMLEKIDGYRQLAIDLQTSLVAIPALGPENDGGGEAEKAAFIESWMAEHIGFDSVEHVDAPDDRVPSGVRPNIVALMKGASADRRIWVMGHLDVVPPGEISLWETDPYVVVEKDGRLYGRGVEDNHHGFVTPLLALKAARELGVELPCDTGVILVSDEETGSRFGIGHLIGERPDLFSENDYILVPDSGVPDGSQIEVAEKSIYWLKVVVRGRQCHASEPGKGINAHRAGAHLITRLDRLYEIYDRRDEVFEPPISTFEPTKKEANVPNVNSIPGEDVFYMDMRVLPGIPLDDVHATIETMVREVEKQFGVTIELSSPQREDAAPATPVDAPVVTALSSAIREIYGVEAKPQGIGGGTVAAFFRRAGLPAVVWSRIDDTAHMPNEHTTIDFMLGDAKVFATLFARG
ncbi:MAG: M20 family metallo-hydrolase [Candidatus Krumholzibacteriota bacterium]|nr:M20 family metallo-hydrolase [Candidatus Krumholzibacteriota bacterium]